MSGGTGNDLGSQPGHGELELSDQLDASIQVTWSLSTNQRPGDGVVCLTYYTHKHFPPVILYQQTKLKYCARMPRENWEFFKPNMNSREISIKIS